MKIEGEKEVKGNVNIDKANITIPSMFRRLTHNTDQTKSGPTDPPIVKNDISSSSSLDWNEPVFKIKNSMKIKLVSKY